MPVIRKPVVPHSSAPPPVEPAAEPEAPTAAPEPAPSAPPAPEVQKALDALARALEAHIAQSHAQTQSRTVRGLEAVDGRAAQRQRASDAAVAARLRDLTARLQSLQAHLHDESEGNKVQIHEVSGRVYSALAKIFDALHQVRSEVAVLKHTVEALESELRLQAAGRSRGDRVQGGRGREDLDARP